MPENSYKSIEDLIRQPAVQALFTCSVCGSAKVCTANRCWFCPTSCDGHTGILTQKYMLGQIDRALGLYGSNGQDRLGNPRPTSQAQAIIRHFKSLHSLQADVRQVTDSEKALERQRKKTRVLTQHKRPRRKPQQSPSLFE